MMNDNSKAQVLFVCLGNICRSPMAEGVFRARVADAGLAEQVEIDSAGTGAWHIGNPPDPRAQAAAVNRDVDITDLRARQVKKEDFLRFDHIIAMDRNNFAALEMLAPQNTHARLNLFLDFVSRDLAKRAGGEVPDPYYGGADGFEIVLDLIEAASEGLLVHVTSTLSGKTSSTT